MILDIKILLKGRSCFIDLPHLVFNVTEIGMKDRAVRFERDRFFDQRPSGLKPSGLAVEYTQKMERIGVVRIDFNELPVHMFGLLKIPRLMMLYGLFQQFLFFCLKSEAVSSFNFLLVLLTPEVLEYYIEDRMTGMAIAI